MRENEISSAAWKLTYLCLVNMFDETRLTADEGDAMYWLT